MYESMLSIYNIVTIEFGYVQLDFNRLSKEFAPDAVRCLGGCFESS